MTTTLITNATIISDGHRAKGALLIRGQRIERIIGGGDPEPEADLRIDAKGGYVVPGVIDTHVHFREPGDTAAADIASESRAAAAGGVTTYIDMPNTQPPTTTIEALADKRARARRESRVNYSFHFGATNHNSALLASLQGKGAAGVKVFMGSSTGDMLVDNPEALARIFQSSPLPIVAHCEDPVIISHNMERAQHDYGADPPVALHPMIRSREACIASSRHAVALAKRYGARLHIAHISTAEEIDLVDGTQVTGEAAIGHLLFCDEDYERKGALIKVNPAIKTRSDRDALRRAIADGRLQTVATDHAPHLLPRKQGGAAKAASGMPMVQFSLVAMLSLADQGVVSMERIVELMCHNPARLFAIEKRGFIREGYFADLAIVRRGEPYTVDKSMILSKCGWSPLEGEQLRWRVVRTLCNGTTIYDGTRVDDDYRGMEAECRAWKDIC